MILHAVALKYQQWKNNQILQFGINFKPWFYPFYRYCQFLNPQSLIFSPWFISLESNKAEFIIQGHITRKESFTAAHDIVQVPADSEMICLGSKRLYLIGGKLCKLQAPVNAQKLKPCSVYRPHNPNHSTSTTCKTEGPFVVCKLHTTRTLEQGQKTLVNSFCARGAFAVYSRIPLLIEHFPSNFAVVKPNWE